MKKSQKQTDYTKILKFALITLIMFVALMAFSYSFANKSDRQTSFPGVDNDSSWIVQKTERGFPLRIVTVYERNGGFWTGYEVDTFKKYDYLNIVVYFIASLLVAYGTYRLLPKS